jgi:GDPmannose 4,6-dehydratase
LAHGVTARRALITGATGQDGSYLAELLLSKGYEVVGVGRDPGRMPDGVRGVQGDLLDPASLVRAVEDVAPDEVYHLAAPTFVPASWDDPSEAMAAIAGATGTLLVGVARAVPEARVFVATSSEIFGDAGVAPQVETSPMRPHSPYGIAKLAAHQLVGVLRERHGGYFVSGITYNHESPRRPERFLPRKVTRGAAAIALGLQDELELGDLSAVRDWSHAADVVRGAWLSLQADTPDDYIFCSGIGRTVGDLVTAAFDAAQVPADRRTVTVNPAFVRPPEATAPIGDPSHARAWAGSPRSPSRP